MLKRITCIAFALAVAGCGADEIIRPDTADSPEGDRVVADRPGHPGGADGGRALGIGPEGLLPEPAPLDLRAIRDERAAAPPGQTFPLVLVMPRGARPGAGGAPVVDNFADAVARVQSGGTIRVFDGTYLVDESVIIGKAVTIEAMSGQAPVVVNGMVWQGEEATDPTRTFLAVGPDAVVTIDGLVLENPQGHSSASSEDGGEMVVRNATFRTTSGVAGGFTWRDGRLVIEDSDFVGGAAGVFASGDDTELVVRSSSFRVHGVVAVQHQGGADGRIEGIDAADCGIRGCARNFGGEVDVVGNRFSESRIDVDPFRHHIVLYAGGGSGRVADNHFDGCGHGDCVLGITNAVFDVTGNRFDVFQEHRTRHVIIGSDGTGGTAPDPETRAPTLHVSDNVIEGHGGSAATDPGNPDAYAVVFSAIQMEHAARGTAFRNSIQNSNRGIVAIDGGVITDGVDNVVELIRTGVGIFQDGAVITRSSDFSDYFVAISVHETDDSASDLTCNWWSSKLGPMPVAGDPDPSLFTPWATEPVAGESVTTCNGTPPTTVRVEAGVTDFESDPPTFPTVADAFAKVAAGGTVLVADGTHGVRELNITKPVAIQAEGPGRPVIDAEDAFGAFRVDDVTSGPVTFRGLEIDNGTEDNIEIFGRSFDRVVIEDNVLHAASGSSLSSAIFSLSASGNEVVIRENEFLGGQVGIHADFSNGRIERNTFTGQAVNSIRFGSDATNLRIAANTLTCGGMSEACIALIPVGDVEVVDNEVTVDISDPMDPAPIAIDARSLVLTGNIVAGVGGAPDPSDQSSFAIRHDAISVFDTESAIVSSNVVENAWVGIAIGDGVLSADGLNNVVDVSGVPIQVAGGGSASIHSSDFTNYDRALDTFEDSDADLTCNWWGSADGPVNPNAPDPSVFTPWATGPVAGTSTTTCSGGL